MKNIFYSICCMLCMIAHSLCATATIQGTVTGTGGGAVSGALIQAIRGNQVRYSTTSDGSGAYTLAGIEPSNYTLVVLASGFQSQIVGVKPKNNQVTTVNFQLTPVGGTIAGTVVDSTTLLPIVGAAVLLFDGLNFIESTTTDVTGAYSVPNLAPGSYVVLVRAATYQAQIQGALVEAGLTATVNFALLANPGTIAGTITDALTTLPIANALVEVYSGFNKVGFADTDINGNYTIAGLAPGSYSVVVSAQDYEAQSIGALVASNATTTINVALTPNPGTVTGQVTDAQTGAPLASATIVVLQNVTIITSIVTDSNGNYTIDNLAPGNYTLVANAAQYKIAIMGVSISSNTIAVVNFALESRSGTIAGTVTDSATTDPISGASIEVFDATILIATAVTDPQGNYQIPDLAPGDYSVVAIATNFQTQIQQATVQAQNTTVVNFALNILPGAISGTVTDATTTDPLANTAIIVFQNQTIVGSALTDVNGNYQVPNLAPGNYFVVAIASGYRTAFSQESVTAGATTVANFALDLLPGAIVGIIQQECTQDPLAGVIVLVTDGQVIVGFAVTDSNGSYVVDNLAPGTYIVAALKNNYFSATQIAQVASLQITIVNFVLNPSVAPQPRPPVSIAGSFIQNHYLTQTDFIHKITWGASPSKCITQYLIFRNNHLIAEVPSSTQVFIDTRYAHKAAVYQIKAVNSFGGISDPVTITFS